jgi:hypothetical protein
VHIKTDTVYKQGFVMNSCSLPFLGVFRRVPSKCLFSLLVTFFLVACGGGGGGGGVNNDVNASPSIVQPEPSPLAWGSSTWGQDTKWGE